MKSEDTPYLGAFGGENKDAPPLGSAAEEARAEKAIDKPADKASKGPKETK